MNMYEVGNGSISLTAQIFLYGGIQVIKGRLSIGFLTAVITYFSNLIQSTNFFLNLGEKFQDTFSSYNRILPYLKMKETEYGKTKINQIEDIRFENVVFKYPDEKELFCFNEKLEMGNIYWLEGRNGIGKTTLVNLFMGLFGLDYNGRILINNKDIKELEYRTIINKKIAIVEQNPYLLLDSVKNNIICKAEVKIDEQVFDELIDRFRLKDVVLRDSQDLTDYQNINLSDGEKQKIVILRMLFSNASVWILDEPTSSLDKESKNVLYEELRRRKKDHIIITKHSDDIIIYASYNNISSIDYPAQYDGVVGIGSDKRISYKENDVHFDSNDVLLISEHLYLYSGNSYLAPLHMLQATSNKNE